LHDTTLEGEREGKEQRVELGPIEPFPQVRAGRDQHDPVVGIPSGDGVRDGLAGALAESTSQHERVVTEHRQPGNERVDVLGSLGEHQAGPARGRGVMDVLADLFGTRLVLADGAEDVLDVGGFVLGDVGVGVVDDELASDELGSFDRGGLDLVADGTALERDERLEAVTPIGR